MSLINQPRMTSKRKQGLQELSQRLMFLFVGLMVFRFGAHIPVPGLDPSRLAEFFKVNENSTIGFLNMFSGGALQNVTIFALGVMPYITASIMTQLFSSVVPSLQQLRKEGESGQKKLNQYTRYGTMCLSLLYSFGLARYLVGNHIAYEAGFNFYFTTVITLVTGTMFLMWLGEQITERGIGNGMSLVIFAGIVSRLPQAIWQSFEYVRQGQLELFHLLIIMIIIFAVVYFVVYMERAQRKIPVHYAQRSYTQQSSSAQVNHLPFKINMAGVIPPIFASSFILFPATLSQLFGNSPGMGWLNRVNYSLSQGQPLHVILFTAAIYAFCFLFIALVFQSKDTADNLKRSGAFIPGIRPGRQTATYIDNVLERLTLIGATYISLICLVPEFMYVVWHVPFYFGGTSLMIVIVVLMEFMSQIQTLLMSHEYESLLRKANFKL